MSSSASSGMSCTTIRSGAAATSERVRSPISGWVMASRSLRARGSESTVSPSAARSREPSAASTASPKRSWMAARPTEPASTTSRANRSASMTTAPSSRNRCATVDLPEPIPPVSPTPNMVSNLSPITPRPPNTDVFGPGTPTTHTSHCIRPPVKEQPVPLTAVPTPSRRARLSWGAVTALTVGLGYLLILLHNRQFFLQDDSESGAVPDWLYIGDRLHRGGLPILTPDAWMGGNWTVEGQNGLWNPVQLAIDYVAPMVDRLDLLAAGVKGCFALVLALGVYRVALAYGARPSWAAVVGAAMPFSGWVLYYDSATWVTALVSLCVLVGEGVRSRSWVPVAKVAAVAIAAALCGLVTFLPGYLTSSVTWRVIGKQAVNNNNMLTAPWSETLNAAIPTALPAIQGFSRQVQQAPVSYIAWFILPVLAFVDWGRARRLVRELTGPLMLLIVMLVVTAGPSNLGPVRWPARMLPLVAAAVLVLIGVLVSRAASLAAWRRKAVIATAVVVISVLRSASASPHGLFEFALWGLVLLVVSALVITLGRRFGGAPAAGAVLVSILAVLWVQVGEYPSNLGVSQWHMPVSRSAAKAHFPNYQGVTLQLGLRAPVKTPADAEATWRSLVFGNYPRTLGLSYVNSYSAVGHQKFSSLLCIRWEGGTCQNAKKYLFAKEPTTGLTYADLMGLDRVVLIKYAFPHAPAQGAPDGWAFVRNGDPLAWILERTTPRPTQPGRVGRGVV